MPVEYKDYALWIGSFEGENFKWKKIRSYNDFDKAYKDFKKFVDTQISYSDDELIEVWSSTRLDIELKEGDKTINWVGISVRQAGKKDDEEEEDSDKTDK